jgi:sigma-B regulation protein RsbU (phosphoserine phosphatase)
VREAFHVVLNRPYDPGRAGVTEAAIESQAPLLITGIEDWPGAAAMRARLQEQLPPEQAQLTWDWYRASSMLSCPVRAPGGRVLGVLAMASGGFAAEDLRTAGVFADLAGVALDRAELLAREERRTEEELLLNRAAREVARSLELGAVYRSIVEQAVTLSGLSMAILTRQEPASLDLRVVDAEGASERVLGARFKLGEGMIGRVAATGEPYVSREADRERFVSWIIEEEGIGSFAHVPLTLGPRLFGVLSVADPERGRCDEALLPRLSAFSRVAAGAIANALDFQRERRVAHALTSGYVPSELPVLEDFEAGVVYAPAGRVAGGGDFFGIWRLPGGAVALLVGDVSGKGIEVAAISAMVRFFVEARTWDAHDPSEVMCQTNALLRGRLPGTTFVPTVMAVIDGGRVRWCNAGHPAPVILAADGGQRELTRTGLPLGVEEEGGYTTAEAPFAAGDLLFAATDGLIEARREGVQFGDQRLAAVLAEHGRRLDPEALVHRMHREAEAWAPALDDDVVILALRRRA